MTQQHAPAALQLIRHFLQKTYKEKRNTCRKCKDKRDWNIPYREFNLKIVMRLTNGPWNYRQNSRSLSIYVIPNWHMYMVNTFCIKYLYLCIEIIDLFPVLGKYTIVSREVLKILSTERMYCTEGQVNYSLQFTFSCNLLYMSQAFNKVLMIF